MADVRLDPMTAEEYEAYLRAAIVSYSESHVAAQSWPAEGARQRAADAYAELLPQGLATPGHHLYTARDGDQRIGMVWFAERPHEMGPVAYIYDIRVDPSLRGKGYGKALLQAAERQVRSAGLNAVRLHVFGHNSVARSLYQKLGYVETNVLMLKQLD